MHDGPILSRKLPWNLHACSCAIRVAAVGVSLAVACRMHALGEENIGPQGRGADASSNGQKASGSPPEDTGFCAPAIVRLAAHCHPLSTAFFGPIFRWYYSR